MTRKAQLLALARSGGAAAVSSQGATLWPDSIIINSNVYRLSGTPGPNAFRPAMIVGHYVWGERGVALTLPQAQQAAGQVNEGGLCV